MRDHDLNSILFGFPNVKWGRWGAWSSWKKPYEVYTAKSHSAESLVARLAMPLLAGIANSPRVEVRYPFSLTEENGWWVLRVRFAAEDFNLLDEILPKPEGEATPELGVFS